MTGVGVWTHPVHGGDSPETLHNRANNLSIRCPLLVEVFVGVVPVEVSCAFAAHHLGPCTPVDLT